MEIKQENGRTTYHYSIKEKEDVSAMVEFTYIGDLQDFLKINFLATEVSFINHKLDKVKQAITELKPIVLFGDEPYYEEVMEVIGSEAIKTKEEIRKLYWWAVRYESFLNDRLQELNQPQQPETFGISDTSTVENKTTFENKFDNVPEIKIIEYFTKNLVEKKYLTKETLDLFLKQAFELKTPPIKKFSFDDIKTRQKIVIVFYEYYKTLAGKPYGQQLKYFDLLRDYFNGFAGIDIKNFSK